MNIYAYNNLNVSLEQISEKFVPEGIFKGQIFNKVFSEPLKIQKSNEDSSLQKKESSKDSLLSIVKSNDVVITSTLANFSLDFVTAIQIISNFDKFKVRVIAFLEKFDSFSQEGKALIAALPLMQNFRKNSFKAREKNRIDGIRKAAKAGKYKGRQAYSVENFKDFKELYEQYMFREIGKSEFAKKLGISRPTLDKLIEEFTS